MTSLSIFYFRLCSRFCRLSYYSPIRLIQDMQTEIPSRVLNCTTETISQKTSSVDCICNVSAEISNQEQHLNGDSQTQR